MREPTLAPAPESAMGLPDPDFLSHLVPDSTPLCSNLRRLRLSNFYALTDETLLAFIRARTESDDNPHVQAQLERIMVRLPHERTFDVAAAHEVVANGLQLVPGYS